MEVRITTLIIAILALLYVWIKQGRKCKAGYLILATIYFLLVIGFNVVSILCNIGVMPPIDVHTLNLLSQAIRIVGVIALAVYAGMPRRTLDGMV